jgi:hypothetical protein
LPSRKGGQMPTETLIPYVIYEFSFLTPPYGRETLTATEAVNAFYHYFFVIYPAT